MIPEAERWVAVGQPIMPDPTHLADLMAEAVATGWLSNGGTLHARLEGELQPWLGGAVAQLVSSGTTALMIALRLGGLPEGSEIITSPISFAASVQAIRWCGFRPVFADVEPDTLSLCPRSVRKAITPRTSAILPVHFLGIPCDVAELGSIAREHGLWLAYDAAHAFGVTVDGEPIALWGSATAFSFHATKLMHTGEGGAVVLPDERGHGQLSAMRNFGLTGQHMLGHGINGKMSEAQAAVGLAVLPALGAEIAARRELRARYDDVFEGAAGITVQKSRSGASDSLIYYALRMRPELRQRLHKRLATARIVARDSFPLLCGTLTCLPDERIVTAASTPSAPVVSEEVLCMPFHGGVTEDDVRRIAQLADECARADRR